MLDRVLKVIIVLTLLCFLAQAVIGILTRLLVSVVQSAGQLCGGFGSLLTGLVAIAALLCLCVGLVLRTVQFLRARNPRAAREHAARERALRTRVRRPAENAPVHAPQVPQPDPDPAINDEPEEG